MVGRSRMIAYPPMLWLMAFGGYLMGQRRAEDQGFDGR